jgi:T5SS/PEP-CTERM-associated repeat protein
MSSNKKCVLLSRMKLHSLALAILVIGLATAPSRGAVTAIGDVLPADNPLTDGVNEGLPPNGNFVDSSEPVSEQTHWELPVDITVGQRSFGRLDIDGNSQLRAQDLIIGDEGMLPGGQTRQGTGFVVISGIDALYNNDPEILPPGLPDNFGSASEFARAEETGFDLYVGRAGVGTLEIRGGGRAEIQHLSIIGDLSGSIGTVLVDGFASYLHTGGFGASGGPVGAPQQMIIGRQGIGTMTISNGGTVVAESIQATGGGLPDTVGAVIGGDVFDTQVPEEGGRGTVLVTGPTSKWIVGGTLQIGGFHDTDTGPLEPPSGENAEYDSTVGRGTLQVADGASVNIRPAIGADLELDDLRLLLGRFGRLELDGGYVSIGSPGQLDGRQDNIALVSDGVISGGGRIDTGLFWNRYFGEIRVGAGQKLLVDATSEFVSEPPDEQPLINWGLIDIIGTPEARAEIEFERAPNTETEANPIRPFLNATVAAAPIGFSRTSGQITAAHSTLRFRSGINNSGKLAFTAGDNYVFGPVVNDVSGEIGIAGNNTTVTFEDHFINSGVFEMFPNSSLALFLNDFTQTAAGTLVMTLGGRPTGNELSFLSMLGDVSLDGGLTVDLFGTGANPINPMAGDQYQILATGGLLSGIFTRQAFPALAPGLDWFVDYNYLAGTVTLQVRDLMNVMGADFNGDGIIDAADLAIWLMFNGLTSGATPAQGDADGDGDVDGDDFLIWQQTIGPVPPGSGSGAAHDLAATVPEPSAWLLLALGSLIGAACRRRSSRRH